MDFDERAAIELALMSETTQGEKKRKEQAGTWAKVKFDRQIVAIAKVNRVKAVYSTDGDVLALALREGLRGFACHDLPIPPPENMELFAEQNPQTEWGFTQGAVPCSPDPEGSGGGPAEGQAGAVGFKNDPK